jgi:hypothetical protein
MDNSDIIEPFYKDGDQIKSCYLLEMSNKVSWQNYQLKKNLKEGEDYMLVDENIHKFWESKYGEVNQIKRFGIRDEADENVVEIYLKQFNIMPIPNKKLFKLEDVQPIYISKSEDMKGL